MHTPVRPSLALQAALLSAVLTAGCGGGADDRALADASASTTTAAAQTRRALAAGPERRVTIARPADDLAVSPHDGLPDPTVSHPSLVPPVAWPPTPPATETGGSASRD
ncbi:hypothetical protein [Ideonella sp. A 288]|uniref:hypothetical protein n=1 Tax=Ideonella sp. A 288 TaxID=1962181 RepID=UPI000B4BD038|nr:hypothetical protein [Ideonella sp. A 288]